MTGVDDQLATVRLLEVPVPLRFKSLQQGAELVREMQLLTIGLAGGQEVPARLVDLAGRVTEQYGPFTAPQAAELEEAYERGVAVVPEVVYRVPAASADMARHLQDILAEAEEYCRSGKHLLTLATPPDVATYRAWMLGEFERQIGGEPPISWPDFARDANLRTAARRDSPDPLT